MFSQNLMLTCWSCLNGHRATSCQHSARPLYALKNKGRPRPGTGRSMDRPDVLSLDDISFQRFREMIMNDPVKRKEYWHEEPVEPTAKPATRGRKRVTGEKRPAPYVVKNRKTGGVKGGGLGNIYQGACTMEQHLRWRELCGVLGIHLGGVEVATGILLPALPKTTMSHGPLISPPDTEIHVADVSSLSTNDITANFIFQTDSIGDPKTPSPTYTDLINPGYLLSHDIMASDFSMTARASVDPSPSPTSTSSNSGLSSLWTLQSTSTATSLAPADYSQPLSEEHYFSLVVQDFLNDLAFEPDPDPPFSMTNGLDTTLAVPPS